MTDDRLLQERKRSRDLAARARMGWIINPSAPKDKSKFHTWDVTGKPVKTPDGTIYGKTRTGQIIRLTPKSRSKRERAKEKRLAKRLRRAIEATYRGPVEYAPLVPDPPEAA